ncbi:transglutaminase-like domain-containing protein [Sphingomonas sp. BIUV-7]|uniref:Transglutaminase-like domain-containing protein n=1 Tax=Sphingomonas natans TaxID=3063330 RepID=A0ABT8YA10_9SPHN|nr:transglutaminase-like domain-containing protein [Sphingomonas sp. BIUV-7]MDO6415171.1 transglutaminase-like domain-containing protein [Sphingomonas sp. BIUV-7]
MDENLTRLGLIDEEAIVLDEAALQLALPDHPETDLDPYHSLLAEIALRLRAVAPDAASPHACADALSLVLNGEYGFTGDRDTYDDPANADLIRAIDRRRGLPVSLSILYVAAARRLGWSAHVLDLPGHVLVLIGEPAESVMIDPFSDGALVPAGQLVALLSASAGPSASDVVEVPAMPNRAILARLLLNQAVRAEDGGSGRRALDLYRRITAFAPDNAHAWWQRARLELVDQDVAAARQSLAAMLEVTRDPALRVTITDTLEALIAS